MQTILGANGVVARELSRALAGATDGIRQVSRNPQRVNPADGRSRPTCSMRTPRRAVAGSEVAYLVAGLKYDTAVWQQQCRA
jgi:hypothetical protein